MNNYRMIDIQMAYTEWHDYKAQIERAGLIVSSYWHIDDDRVVHFQAKIKVYA